VASGPLAGQLRDYLTGQLAGGAEARTYCTPLRSLPGQLRVASAANSPLWCMSGPPTAACLEAITRPMTRA
jgi:hypothetical protein